MEGGSLENERGAGFLVGFYGRKSTGEKERRAGSGLLGDLRPSGTTVAGANARLPVGGGHQSHGNIVPR